MLFDYLTSNQTVFHKVITIMKWCCTLPFPIGLAGDRTG